MKKLVQKALLTMLVLLFVSSYSFPQVEFETGKIAVQVNEYGRLRVHFPAIDNLRQIDRSSWLIGVAADKVFDYKNDAEAHDSSKVITLPKLSDYEIYGSYDNTYSGAPPDFLEKMYVYGWNNEAFLLVKMTAINQEATTQRSIIGLEFIAQIDGVYGNETLNFLNSKNIAEVFNTKYVGFKFLKPEVVSFRAVDWYDGYELGDTAIFSWLTYTKKDTSFSTGGDGGIGIMATAPVDILSGDSATVYLAITAGETRAEMETAMTAAENKFATLTSVSKDDSKMPTGFSLKQNYPNPFNPSTKISFSLPVSQNVVLKIFNSLGQEISTLINSEFDAGNYTYNFTADNLTSGIYFYTLNAGSFSSSKKMLLVK
ncbi:MAG: T9SS type A sorting domain-containing protein [Ignavibacteriales bacterium]|nr:T9SS type A sorting domain-containing protein [Ignavibacteriales bacterium]